MTDDTPQKELLQEVSRLLRRFQKDGDIGPIDDRDEWENLVESKSLEERELIRELARFTDLWRYFQERGEKLGSEIVNAISAVHQFPVHERSARIEEINRKLMERVGDAGSSAQLRQ
jgi:MoxR-like ATPase